MANAVVMPRQGQSVESCILTGWSKSVGESVIEGEVLFSYETDKSSFEEPAKASGTLLARFFDEDDDVPCLSVIAVIGKEGEDISEFANEAPTAPPAKDEEKPAQAASAVSDVSALAHAQGGASSPRARELAKRAGVDITRAVGTGPYSRIIERDVYALMAQGEVVEAIKPEAKPLEDIIVERTAQDAEYELVKLSNTRKTIAKGMLRSLSSTAQLTNHSSFDASEILALRAKLKKAPESFGLPNITINDILIFACSRVLKRHPDLNAHFVDGELRRFKHVHLGVAVDTPNGLLVPTIFNADMLSLSEISSKVKELAAQALSRSINPDLLVGASFTLSNLGALGVEYFTPVINPPQTGILGIGCITHRVKPVEGEVCTYPSMGLSLTYDHQVVDGAPAAKFALDLKEALENISCLLT